MGFYNLTYTFASLSGDQPAQKLDDNFSQLAVMPLYATLVSGTSDAIAITVPMTVPSYQAGMVFNFVAALTNATATPTLNVNSLGAKTIVKQGNGALSAADIVQNSVYSVYYDGTNFHLFNPTNTNQHQSTNVVINGAMNVDQRYSGAGVAAAPTGTYIVDRFQWFKSGVGGASVTQSSTVPTSLTASLKKSALVQVTTTDGTLSGSDRYGIQYAIEGYDTQPMLDNTFTVSFYAVASVAGTYCLAVTNAAGTYNYIKEYSLPVANTWYYISVTIPNGLVSANFTNTTTSFNAYLLWSLGQAITGPNSAWNTTSGAYATSNQTNLFATNGATFRLTGVQLFQGQSTPEIEPRLFGDELALCRRYYFQQTVGTGGNWGTGFAPTTSTFYGFVSFPTSMRVAPSALLQTGTASDYSVGYNNTSAACTSVPVFLSATETSAVVTFTTGAVLTQGNGGRLRSNAATTYLAWDVDN